MTERVFIRWPEQQQDPVDWGVLADNAPEFSQLGQLASLDDLAELVPSCQTRPVVVILPSSLVHFCAADLPSRQLRHVQKAVPFTLEEQLAEDIDELHFALPSRLPSQGKIPVVVLAKELLQRVLHSLEAVELTPIALVPDVLLLADAPGWTLLASEQSFWLRQDNLQGLMAQGPLMDLLWQRQLKDAADNLPQQLTLLVTSPEVGQVWQDKIPAGIELAVEVIGHPLEWLAKGFNGQTFNLLQGEYATKDPVSRYLQPWKTAAYVFGILVFCFLVVSEFERQSLIKQQAQIRAETSQLIRQHFPGIGRVVKLRSQVDREIKALSGGPSNDGFLNLIQQTSEAFAAHPDIRPSAISFEAKEQELRMDLTAKDYAGLQQLQQQLQQHELLAELNSANAKDNGFAGRLVLRSKSDQPEQGGKRK